MAYKINIPQDLKYLIIHESPSEAKTANQYIKDIEKKLGGKTIILASVGHIYKTKNDLDDKNYKLDFYVDNTKKDVVNNLKKAYQVVKKNKGKVIIGTDPDREGEVIAFSIYDVLKLRKGDFKRMRLRSLEKKGYLKVLSQLEDDLDWNMVDSGIARQYLDKYIGFKKTAKLWEISKFYKKDLDSIKIQINNFIKEFYKKNKLLVEKNKSLKTMIENYKKLDFDRLNDFKNRQYTSIGRVQTPTLRLLVEKDLEKFKKELQRKLNLFVYDNKKNKWEYDKNSEYETQSEKIEIIYKVVKDILEQNIKYEITKIEKSIKKVNPPSPLDTQKAQTTINQLFGYSLKDIMNILQENYQKGYSTYMRTDSIDIPDEFKDIIRKTLKENNVRAKYIDRDYESKDAQAGHHSILPTRVFDFEEITKLKDIGEKNKKVLEFILRTALASLLEPAEIEYITYYINIDVMYKGKSKTVQFILKDKQIVKKGFLEVYTYNLKEYQRKNNFKKGDIVELKDIEIKEKDIKLPGTYTEGSLVKELKKLGVGRPSTWEGIVSTLLDKGYIEKQGGKLVINEKGYWVYQTIINHIEEFGKIFDLGFTAKMEEYLDKIEKGVEGKDKILKQIIRKIND